MTPPDAATLHQLVDMDVDTVSAESESADERIGAETGEITGSVSGSVPEGSIARGVQRTLQHAAVVENVIAESEVDSTGAFRLEYLRPAGTPSVADASVHVRIVAPDGATIATSAPMSWPPENGTAHLELQSAHQSNQSSEYAILEAEIGSLESGVDALEGAEDSVVEEVSQWLDVDADRLQLFQVSRELERETDIPAAAFYALGRSGAGPELDDLIDVPVHELRSTLEDAVREGIIEAASLGDVEVLSTRLAERILEQAVSEDREASEPGIADVLAAADLPTEVVRGVLQRYQSRTGEDEAFWESFSQSPEAETIGEDALQQVEAALELGEVLGPDPDLLRRVHELRREGRWQRRRSGGLHVRRLVRRCRRHRRDDAAEAEAKRRRRGREDEASRASRSARRDDPRHARRGVSERVHSTRALGTSED